MMPSLSSAPRASSASISVSNDATVTISIEATTPTLGHSMGSVAWLFPGQGSQVVGMGKELAERYPAAMHVFAEASAAIGLDLKRLCWEGPQTELDRTANTQPALLTASIAALRAA